MQILVKTMSSKTIIVNVEPDETISDVKAKIYEAVEEPPEIFYLRYASNRLDDDSVLSSIPSLSNLSTVFCCLSITSQRKIHFPAKTKHDLCVSFAV